MVDIARNRSLKVLLIYPPRDYFITSGLPHLVEADIGFYKPLGLLYLAANVKARTNHEVQVIDAQVENLHVDDIEKIIAREKPDVVGMTALTLMLYDVYLTALAVKRVHPACLVVVGGPHVSIYPEETVRLPGVDVAVPDEGEISFIEILNCISNGNDLSRVPGVFFEKNGYIVNTGRRDVVGELDSLAFPDRRAVPYEKYFSLVDSDELSTTMITSRGCPSQCIFCDIPHKTYRDRSPENIAAELEDIVSLGINEVYFYDDTFNLTRPRVIKMCREIIRRKIPVRFAFRGRVKPMDEEMIDLLREAGCKRIQYGVEAGNDRILRILKKGVRVSDIQSAFGLTHRAGIETVAYFMVGSPGERKEDIFDTIQLAKDLGTAYAVFSITTPFPNTEMYDMGLREGVLSHDYWLRHAQQPVEYMDPELWEKDLTREEIYDLFNKAYREFYFRPNHILRELMKVRSPVELGRKAIGALKMARDVFV